MALKGPINPEYGSSQDSVYRVSTGGTTQETINRVRYRIRHPEGRYIPIGRGIYGGKPLPQQTDRRDVVPVTLGARVNASSPGKPAVTIIPKMVGQTNQPSPVASPPVVRRSPVPQKTPPIPTKQKTRPTMDLGDILGTGLDLYGKYLNIRNPTRVSNPIPAPIPAVGVAATTPITSWPGAGYGVAEMARQTFIDAEPGGGFPGVDIISEPPTDDTKGWVYKKVCGVWKWTKPKRRRRRKLLTDSDYNGLLKLQTLKVNSNMNIAIAKSIGR